MRTRPIVPLIAALVLIVCAVAAGYAAGSGGDDQAAPAEYTCAGGQWSDATVASAAGPLGSSVHAQLPPGTSVVTSSGGQKITTRAGGRITGEGGDLTVVCVTPTHR